MLGQDIENSVVSKMDKFPALKLFFGEQPIPAKWAKYHS